MAIIGREGVLGEDSHQFYIHSYILREGSWGRILTSSIYILTFGERGPRDGFSQILYTFLHCNDVLMHWEGGCPGGGFSPVLYTFSHWEGGCPGGRILTSSIYILTLGGRVSLGKILTSPIYILTLDNYKENFTSRNKCSFS